MSEELKNVTPETAEAPEHVESWTITKRNWKPPLSRSTRAIS